MPPTFKGRYTQSTELMRPNLNPLPAPLSPNPHQRLSIIIPKTHGDLQHQALQHQALQTAKHKPQTANHKPQTINQNPRPSPQQCVKNQPAPPAVRPSLPLSLSVTPSDPPSSNPNSNPNPSSTFAHCPAYKTEKSTWWGCGNHIPAVLTPLPREEWCTCEPKVEKEGVMWPPMGKTAD